MPRQRGRESAEGSSCAHSAARRRAIEAVPRGRIWRNALTGTLAAPALSPGHLISESQRSAKRALTLRDRGRDANSRPEDWRCRGFLDQRHWRDVPDDGQAGYPTTAPPAGTGPASAGSGFGTYLASVTVTRAADRSRSRFRLRFRQRERAPGRSGQIDRIDPLLPPPALAASIGPGSVPAPQSASAAMTSGPRAPAPSERNGARRAIHGASPPHGIRAASTPTRSGRSLAPCSARCGRWTVPRLACTAPASVAASLTGSGAACRRCRCTPTAAWQPRSWPATRREIRPSRSMIAAACRGTVGRRTLSGCGWTLIRKAPDNRPGGRPSRGSGSVAWPDDDGATRTPEWLLATTGGE